MTKNETLKNWVEQYSEPLLKRAAYLLSDRTEAEDIVQEVFLAAFSSYGSFEGKKPAADLAECYFKQKSRGLLP